MKRLCLKSKTPIIRQSIMLKLPVERRTLSPYRLIGQNKKAKGLEDPNQVAVRDSLC